MDDLTLHCTRAGSCNGFAYDDIRLLAFRYRRKNGARRTLGDVDVARYGLLILIANLRGLPVV